MARQKYLEKILVKIVMPGVFESTSFHKTDTASGFLGVRFAYRARRAPAPRTGVSHTRARSRIEWQLAPGVVVRCGVVEVGVVGVGRKEEGEGKICIVQIEN